MKKTYKILAILMVVMYAVPTYGQNAGFTPSTTNGCIPLPVQFASDVTTGTHQWTFGNGNGSSFPNPTATYTSAGTYTVTHKHTVNGTTDTKTTTITVHPSPTADFSATPNSICPGDQVTFTFTGTLGTSGGATYSWVFGNGAAPATGTGSPVTATYSNTGTNSVTLKVTNSKNCFASVTKQNFITVKDKPQVSFTASPKNSFCSSETPKVTFNPTITGGSPGPYTYAWEFGGPGNPTSSVTSPTHTYPGPAPAQYNVKLTVQSTNGCSGSLSAPGYIKLHKPDAGFTGPAKACVFTTVTFNNTSTPTNATHTWFFGDGSSSQQTLNGTHMYNAPGIYTVKLITSISGCDDTITKNIEILPQPNPVIETSPDSVCPAPQQVCYSTVPAMATYDWNIENENGINTFTTANPCVMFGKNGCWPTVLRVTDANGCKDTVLHTLPINELNIKTKLNKKYVPYPRYIDSGCVSFQAAFTVSIETGDPAVHSCYGPGPGKNYPYGIKTVKWDFGNGATSTSTNPVYTYTDSGDFKITVEVETNNGCVVKDSMRIKVGYKPIIDSIYISDTVICPKSSVNFIGYVRGYDTLTYRWDFGDFSIRTKTYDSTYNHFYFGGPPCIDTHTIKLVAYHKGCPSDTFVSSDAQKYRHVVMLPPCARFEWEIENCSKPLTVNFYNRSTGDSSLLWMFGDGATSTQQNPIHTYPVKGLYKPTLIAYNDSTGCYDTMVQEVYFGDNPPDIIANKRTLCVGDSVTFLAYLTGDTANAAFTWYINGLQVASFPADLTYTFNNPGLYTIKAVSYNGATKCSDTVEKVDWITVGGPTAGFFSDDTYVCRPDTIHFTDTSFAGDGTTLVSRRWYFGTSATDIAVTTNTSIYKFYSTTGDFDVSLIVTDDIGCKDTVYKQKYAHVLKPIADYTVNTPACVGGATLFTNTSTNADSYSWTFGDGGTDMVNRDPTHVYNTIGTFNTQLIVTDTLGCKDTSAIVTVTTTKPIANFTASDSVTVCAPLIVNFDASPSVRANRYTWYFDDGSSPGFKKNHTVVYNNAKEYNVKLIVEDALGCKDSVTKPIRVLGYAGAFDYTPTEGCAPLTVDFTSNVKGNIPSIIWDFGDGNSLLGDWTVPKISYTYETPGRYLPRMIFNNGLGCQIGSEGLDTIVVDDVTADFETESACQFSNIEFINKSTTIDAPLQSNYWTFHDGGFSALNNPRRNYGPPGSYKVKLVATNARGCIDSVEKDIIIHEPIQISALGDTIICLADSAHLVPAGGVSYLWSPGASLSCSSCNDPYAFPKEKTLYNVISTDVNGCHDTVEVEVDIKTHVESIVGEGGEICDGESMTLKVEPANGKDKLTYQWIPGGSANDPTSGTPSVSPSVTTNYMVVASEGSCVPDSSFVEVIVHPRPEVGITGGGQIVAGTSTDLLASGENIVRFEWTPSATLSCSDCSDPVASPYKTTEYTVIVHSKYECVDSAKTEVSVLCDESQLFVPNTFTPNGDGMNDVFMVRGEGISTLKSFRVYNRWGEVMFERLDATVNDKTNGWDGTYNGAQLPPDVYVYTVEAYCENGDLLKLKGDITIIR